jgi:thiol-disulfide isomerase/thioredoxin
MLFNKNNMTLLEPKHFIGGKLKHKDFNAKHGMVIIAAEWCGYCQQAKEPWIQFRKIAKKQFGVAAVDAVKYPALVKKLNITGYPTIIVIDKKGNYETYTGSRDIFSLTDKLCSLDSSNSICKK